MEALIMAARTDLVIIVGLPATGKTTLTAAAAKKLNLLKFHTDDYMEDYGAVEGLYELLNDLALNIPIHRRKRRPILVEGVMGGRLVRKIEERDLPYTYTIIAVERPSNLIELTYATERIGRDYKRAMGTGKACFTALNQGLNVAEAKGRRVAYHIYQNQFA